MENKKLLSIIEGVATIALGVLIAIFGTKTLGLYFGIMLIVVASGFLAIAIANLVKTKELKFVPVLGFGVAITFGVLLVVYPELVEFFITLFVYFLIAFGGALVLYGIYSLVKHSLVYGAGQITLGAVVITLGLLYLFVWQFRVAFWIIVGVVVALSGVFLIVATLLNKDIKEIKEVTVVKDAE